MNAAEKTLLVNSLPMGQIVILSAGQIGKFVRAGAFDFYDEANPALQAEGIDALESLIAKGLVRHESKIAYKLTGRGFEEAKAHAENAKN